MSMPRRAMKELGLQACCLRCDEADVGGSQRCKSCISHHRNVRELIATAPADDELLQFAKDNTTVSEKLKEQDLISNASFELSKLAIPTTEGLELVDFDQIIRCEADRAYCKFFLANKTRLVVSKSLKEFEEMLLAKNFIKTHKSHIINITHLAKYVRGVNGYLVMSDGSSIPVSSRKKEEVLSKLKQS